MALKGCGGFDMFGAQNQVPLASAPAGVYLTGQSGFPNEITTTGGRNGRTAMQFGKDDGGALNYIARVMQDGPVLDRYYGVAFKPFQWADNHDWPLLQIRTASGTAIVTIYRQATTGFIVAKRGSYTGTTVATGSVPALQSGAGVWYWITAHIVIDGSAGVVEVKVNGSTVLNATGLNTDAASGVGASLLVMGPAANISTGTADARAQWDDHAWADDGHPPDTIVDYVPADGDTAQADWTGAAADIDEANINTADSITAGLDGDRSDFTHSAAPTAVLAVQPVAYAKQDSIGSQTQKLPVISGATDTESTDTARALGTAYGLIAGECYAVDPNTGVAWSDAAVAALKVGALYVA